LYINAIGTQASVKDSETFDIEIYKDKGLTQLITKTDGGAKII
jgi:hypothetical protein